MTHFHWDHIQGIPFFSPLYRAGNAFLFLSAKRKREELRCLIEGQMGSPHFPVDMNALGAARTFCGLDSREINIENAQIRTAPLNHPQGSVAYRIDADGSSLVFATDTEPGSPDHDRALRELAQGADILVYDAQYTPEQLQAEKKGWGHGSWLEGVRIAHDCGVQRLILFHHDPDSDDEYVDSLVERARELFQNAHGAAEGLEISLPKGEIVQAYEPAIARRERRLPIELPVRVIWGKENGQTGQVEGLMLNVSKSTIYFLVPENVPSNKKLELEFAIPSEVTGRGQMTSHVVALPIRQRPVNRTLAGKGLCIGVVARRIESLESTANPRGLSASKEVNA
jgi:phosphoribosyl 1,2-cyclic phosphodiesterase